jgi:hypothetical protein
VVHEIQPEVKSEPVNIQLSPSVPEPPRKSDTGLMKWFVAGAAIAAVLMIALFFLTAHTISSYFPNNPNAEIQLLEGT